MSLQISDNNLPLHIKYIFLSFAQALFTDFKPYTWTSDVRTTGILIVDSFAIDTGKPPIRPAIIVSRGGINQSFMTKGIDATNSVLINERGMHDLVGTMPNAYNPTVFSDIVYTTITYNIISKNGIVAEGIANFLYNSLLGYKDYFTKLGVIRFTSLNMSGEQLIKSSSQPELVGISINIGIAFQHTVARDEKYHYIKVYDGEKEIFELFDFTVLTDNTIHVITTSGNSLTATYTDAVSLGQHSNIPLIPIGVSGLYELQDGGPIRGYYTLSNNFYSSVNGYESVPLISGGMIKYQ